MKKTSAEWTADLRTNCPYCGECNFIDYGKIDDWWYCLGYVCESTKDLDYIHTCDDCGKEFIIDSTVW